LRGELVGYEQTRQTETIAPWADSKTAVELLCLVGGVGGVAGRRRK